MWWQFIIFLSFKRLNVNFRTQKIFKYWWYFAVMSIWFFNHIFPSQFCSIFKLWAVLTVWTILNPSKAQQTFQICQAWVLCLRSWTKLTYYILRQFYQTWNFVIFDENWIFWPLKWPRHTYKTYQNEIKVHIVQFFTRSNMSMFLRQGLTYKRPKMASGYKKYC